MNELLTHILFLFILLNCVQLNVGLHLKIAWLVPDSTVRSVANTETSAGALKLALDVVNRNDRLLVESNIRMKHFPVDCEMTSLITTSLSMRRTYHPDVIIGPPCQEGMKTIGLLAADWNLPVFAWYNMGSEFYNSSLYPTMIRLIPSVTTLSNVTLDVIRQFNQTHFTAIYHKSAPWSLAHESLVKLSRDAAMTVTSYQLEVTSQAAISTLLQAAKSTSTILVIVCPSDIVRIIMLEAAKQGMTNGRFTFIRLDPEITSGDLLSDNGWRKGDVFDSDARLAYRFLIHIVFDPMYDNDTPTHPTPTNRFADFASLVQGSITQNSTLWDLPPAGQPGIYSMFLYDVVLLWAAVTDRMLKLEENYRNGRLFASTARQFRAKGATGFISLNEKMDRHGKVFVLNMDTTGKFKPLQIHRSTPGGMEVIHLAPLGNKRMTSSVGSSEVMKGKSGISLFGGGASPKKVIKMGTFTSFKSKTKSENSQPIAKFSSVVPNLMPTTVLSKTTATEPPYEGVVESTAHLTKGEPLEAEHAHGTGHHAEPVESASGHVHETVPGNAHETPNNAHETLVRHAHGAGNHAEPAESISSNVHETLSRNVDPYANKLKTVADTGKSLAVTTNPITGEYNEPADVVQYDPENGVTKPTITTSPPTVTYPATTQSVSVVTNASTFTSETKGSGKSIYNVVKIKWPYGVTTSTTLPSPAVTTPTTRLTSSTTRVVPTTVQYRPRSTRLTRPTLSPRQKELQKMMRENYQKMMMNLKEELGLPDFMFAPNEAVNDFMAENKHLFETSTRRPIVTTTLAPTRAVVKTAGQNNNRRTVIVIDSSKLGGAAGDTVLKQIADLLKQSRGTSANKPVTKPPKTTVTTESPTEEPWWFA